MITGALGCIDNSGRQEQEQIIAMRAEGQAFLFKEILG